jgi:hypothetical protein
VRAWEERRVGTCEWEMIQPRHFGNLHTTSGSTRDTRTLALSQNPTIALVTNLSLRDLRMLRPDMTPAGSPLPAHREGPAMGEEPWKLPCRGKLVPIGGALALIL